MTENQHDQEQTIADEQARVCEACARCTHTQRCAIGWWTERREDGTQTCANKVAMGDRLAAASVLRRMAAASDGVADVAKLWAHHSADVLRIAHNSPVNAIVLMHAMFKARELASDLAAVMTDVETESRNMAAELEK